jgi:excisionase family DNA binding protein
MKNTNRTHRVSVLAQRRYYRRPGCNLQDLLDLPLQFLLGDTALEKNVRFRIPISFPDDDQEYLNITETAVRLKVTERTLRRWMKSGRVPFLRIGGRPLFNYRNISDAFDRFFRVPANGSNQTNPRKQKGPDFHTSKYSKILGNTPKYS